MMTEKSKATGENRNNNKKKSMVSLLLAMSMALALVGCVGGGSDAEGVAGTDTANADAVNANDSAGAQTQNGDLAPADGQTAMGRYVEEEIDLTEQMSYLRSMSMMEDGSIVIMDSKQGVFVSEDQGTTWSQENPEWFDAMKSEGLYISIMTMAPDGTAAVVYDPVKDDEGWNPVAKLCLTDGTEVPVELNLTEEDGYIRNIVAAEDGRLFARTNDSIYEVYKDGSGERVLTPDDSAWIWVKDNLLFVDCDWNELDMPVVYDMDAKAYVEDEVLMDFVGETYSDRYYNGDDYGTMQLLPGDGGTVYIVGSKGIHRHAVGGNMVEQIVDGNLSFLSNPDYVLVSVLQLENDVFLALCANGKLIRFTYDPDVPTVPENMLTIYSLKENDEIRQAISYYQTLYPDWFVSYQIGMSNSDSVTREDAIKKLNTEIMAGTGPDLIVLDDLPINSYASKGLLLDLTDYFMQYSAKEPLFHNMIDAMKIDGKAYAAPAVVSIPVIAAKETYIMHMDDLSGIAETLEKMRQDYPDENLTGMVNTGEVMKRFAATSEPAWVKEDGTLDMDSIEAYLEQCRRIYNAQINGLDEGILTKYLERNERLASYEGIDVAQMDWSAGSDIMGYISDGQHVVTGWIKGVWYYCEMISLEKTQGYEDTQVIPMQGQYSKLFMPQTMLAINATSTRVDTAKQFMDVFLSADVQSNYYGYPLNQAAFDIQFAPRDNLGPDNEYGSIGSSSREDGTEITYQVYWPTDEQVAAFKAQLASVSTAYIPDSVLEKAVLGSGTFYLSGDRSLEETLREIERTTAIYMAE